MFASTDAVKKKTAAKGGADLRIIEEAITRMVGRAGNLGNHIFGEPLPENGMVPLSDGNDATPNYRRNRKTHSG